MPQHARFNTASNPIGNPYRWGFSDAVLGKPSECPWKGVHFFWKQVQYNRGYLAGQDSGVKFAPDIQKLLHDKE